MHLPSLALECLFFAVAFGATTENPTGTLKERANQAQPGIPACSTVATTPPPFHLKCGAEGSLDSPVPIISNVKVNNFDQCKDLCINDRNCISFSYKTAGKKCSTYSDAIVRQNFVKGTTGVYFYNRSCYKVTCQCRKGYAICGSYCANLLTDTSNCGACGKECDPTETCYEGACYPTACNNVIDCDAGIYGPQVYCGSQGSGICFCADVDGSSPGLCATSDPCSEKIPCTSTESCREGYICSFGSCCATGNKGVCKKALKPVCRNQNAPGRVFHKSSGTTVLTDTGYA